MVRIYNGILLSHKKNKIMPFAATWMQLVIILPSKVSQKEKNYYINAYIWNLENGIDEPICRDRMEMPTQRMDLWTQ